ncbi:MAG: fatty acid desaturase [Halobacteriales archaeon]|jgi:fatty acid desaturase
MVTSTDAPVDEPRRNRSRSGSLASAFVGAVVTVVFSFIPFSPVLGGAVAAYLKKDDSNESLRVGAITGIMAAAPLVLIITFVFGFLSLIPLAEGEPVATGFFWVILLFSAGVILVYSVSLSAAGGFVGHVLLEREDRRERPRPGTRVQRDRSGRVRSDVREEPTGERGDADDDEPGEDRKSDEDDEDAERGSRR